MPFIQRCLEPINVSRVEVEKGIQNELECVTNHTLSNIILQLSSLSKHAEDMFTELSQEVQTFTHRTRQLGRRIGKLKETVTTLHVSEEVSIRDAAKRKPYKNSTRLDQQVVSKGTAPRCVLKAHSLCEAKPALDKLNQFRVDGRDCLKFYTNPDFFIELWLKEIQRDIRNKEKLIRKQTLHQRIGIKKDGYRKRTPRSLPSIVKKYEHRKHGVEFSSNNSGSVKANAFNNQPRSLDVHGRKPDNKSNEHRNQQAYLNKSKYSHDVPKKSKIHIDKNNAGLAESQKPLNIQSNISNLQRQLSKTVSLRAAARPIEPPPPPPPTYKLLLDTAAVNRSSPINQYPSPCTPLPFLNPEQNLPPPPSPPPPYMEQEDALPPPPSLCMIQEVAPLPPPPPPPYIEPKMVPPPPPPPLPPIMGKAGEVDDEKSNWVTSLKGLLSASRKLKPTPKRQPKDDNRSKLMQEIKQFGRGKLRPVDKLWEEKIEEKPIPAANIDVHALMEKMLSISEMIQPSDEEDEENSSEDDDDWN